MQNQQSDEIKVQEIIKQIKAIDKDPRKKLDFLRKLRKLRKAVEETNKELEKIDLDK